MDGVDLEAARSRKIVVRNTPDDPTRAVAELTLAYVLDLLRRVSLMDRELRSGVWKKRMGGLLLGKRLAVIGFGRIGRAVAELFSRMGCEVGFWDPAVDSDVTVGDSTYRRMDKNSLLAWADILSLHCAKPADGCLVLDRESIALMKKGAFLINAARGGLADEDALAAALENEMLAGAALDVFGREPYSGPLTKMDQVVLTPHIGSYAVESRVEMETQSVSNLLESLGAVSQ